MNRSRAIGRIIKRYRTILRNCHVRNTFGALAVTGLLIMGSASGARAVATPAYWENPSVTISSGETQTVDELYDFEYKIPGDTTSDRRNIRTTSLTIDGGSLTLSNGGMLSHESFDGQPGLTVSILDGQLHIDAASGRTAGIYADTIAISGGSVKLDTQNSSTISLSGSSGISITGGTVEMNERASLTSQRGLLEIAGNSIVKLTGTGSTNSTLLGWEFHLGGNAAITLEEGTYSHLHLQSATIADSATFLIKGDLNVYQTRPTGSPSTVNQTGGTITIWKDDGAFLSDRGNLSINKDLIWQLNGGRIVNTAPSTSKGSWTFPTPGTDSATRASSLSARSRPAGTIQRSSSWTIRNSVPCCRLKGRKSPWATTACSIWVSPPALTPICSTSSPA